MMEHDWEYFDVLIDDPDSLSTEEHIRLSREFVGFMKVNQERYGFTDEQIVEAETKIEAVEQAAEAEKESFRQFEIADKKLEQSAAAYDDAMAEIMEKGGKVIPVYTNLPKRRGN